MPYRAMNLEQVGEHLHLSRQAVERLVKEKEIPFELQGDRVVFRKAQVEAWASQHILKMSEKHLTDYHKASSARAHDLSAKHALMPEMLSAAAIDPELTSRTKASVLRDVVRLADRTGLVCDSRDLLESLKAREEMCSTALAGGFALLHPRHHEPYMFTDSFIAMARAIQPIHADAPDGRPTDLFLLICCQDDRIHLHILARLAAMCQHTSVLAELRAAGNSEQMRDAMIESEITVIGRM